jgi:protein NrfD
MFEGQETRAHHGYSDGAHTDGAGPRGQENTYYGLPAVKRSHYRWAIVGYFFIGGLASASQFIATVLDVLGSEKDRPVVRGGRYLALAGALISPLLLIADLETPKRWYNMLRIYRPTSPMSIGSWSLTSFGLFSGLTAMGQFVQDLLGLAGGRAMARIFGLPAALSGGLVSLYTGTLLAASNLPLWAGGFPFLSSLFAGSATSTASAALALIADASGADETTQRRLKWFGAISSSIEFVMALLVERSWRRNRAIQPLNKEPYRSTWRFGFLGLGVLGPLSLHLTDLARGRQSRPVTAVAAVMTLVGGFILRAVLVIGGNESAEAPEDYYQFTRSDAFSLPSSDGREERTVYTARRAQR